MYQYNMQFITASHYIDGTLMMWGRPDDSHAQQLTVRFLVLGI